LSVASSAQRPASAQVFYEQFSPDVTLAADIALWTPGVKHLGLKID
jgi:hypothetical protein